MAQPVRIVGHRDDVDDNEQLQAQVKANGSLCVSDEGWMISDMDETTDASYKYYGFVDKDGRWYIMRSTVASPVQYRYLAGTSGYTLAWTARVGAGYDYYYTIF
jgi:hypothetical protein